jgi:energy-coupling factor transporter ATP-binding protein EcfA2
MTGARFVRADLHVHLVPDGQEQPVEPLEAYFQAAVHESIEVVGITDHNTARFCRDAIEAAAGRNILVLPGVEVSSRDGHLLALFGPDQLDELDGFATPENLDLGPRLPDGGRRSSRTMLHLLNEISERNGIALIAHCDREGGIQASVGRGELAELLSHPALAGIEFYNIANLRQWFTEGDDDEDRRDAWRGRERSAELRDRGLARVMSSDAHGSALLGRIQGNRAVTRLRVGELTYTAVRNALVNNPKSRCKLEADVPASFPHVESATFEGGFLAGVTIDFAQNLNCLIGGRGSGKSTALLAIRSALGADVAEDEDPDDPLRMPDRTVVRFIDAAGTERIASRDRGGAPVDEEGNPVELQLADLGQGETALVASDYRTQRLQMLAYLDSFCDLADDLDAEQDVLERLTDNGAEVVRTAYRAEDHQAASEERKKLDAAIKKAESGKLEIIAKWARLLATQAALIDQVQARLARVTTARAAQQVPALASIADETGTDLMQRPISEVREPLDTALAELNAQLRAAEAAYGESIKEASSKVSSLIDEWGLQYEKWESRRRERQAELEAEGLHVQVGALQQMGDRLRSLTRRLSEMEEKRKQHANALHERDQLLVELRSRRARIFARRRGTLRLVAQRANRTNRSVTISVSFRHEGVRKQWREWLGPRFSFRGDRLRRLALSILPWEFASSVRTSDLSRIESLTDAEGDGQPFFTSDDMEKIESLGYEELFELETMRLQDLPRIEVTDADHGAARGFDHLSTGQQHSVLLSLLLCADRTDPLIIDQPEDHLDAPYVASVLVGNLEEAKEKRQIIIATHNANLTVLGDAELVVPLYAMDATGRVRDAGAVDHPDTLRHVCRLLEGGAVAYARRGMRYGFNMGEIPAGLAPDGAVEA